MKLLFDQNLSPHLVTRLLDLYPDSVHVSTVGLEAETDRAIWLFARDNGLTIVSKDSDLSEMGVIDSFPPSLVWIRRGNCSTNENVDALAQLEELDPGGILVL